MLQDKRNNRITRLPFLCQFGGFLTQYLVGGKRFSSRNQISGLFGSESGAQGITRAVPRPAHVGRQLMLCFTFILCLAPPTTRRAYSGLLHCVVSSAFAVAETSQEVGIYMGL